MGWLPHAQRAEQESYGAWIEVHYWTGENGGSFDEMHGEFIGLRDGIVFILAADTVHPLGKGRIRRAKLTAYDAGQNILAAWTVLGSLSSASHGWAAVLSFPLWIITGSLATAGQSHAAQMKFPVDGWDELSHYARFPQGVPEGVDVSRLRAKHR
jgi:hypothetical protein